MIGILISFIIGFIIQEGIQVMVRKNDEPFTWGYYLQSPKNIIAAGVNLLVGVLMLFGAFEIFNIREFEYPLAMSGFIGFSVGTVVKLMVKFVERIVVNRDGTP